MHAKKRKVALSLLSEIFFMALVIAYFVGMTILFGVIVLYSLKALWR